MIKSWRDVSGPIKLENLKYKNFIKLFVVELKVEFLNDGSELDYKSQVDEFKANNNKD